MGPKGERFSDEPSGDVAVKSDSTGPSPPDSPAGSSSAWEQKMDHPPGPPNEPAMLTVGWANPAVAAPTPGVASPTPAAFGRYQVRDAIGAGGFGTVYLGHDTQLDRPVAIKVHRGSAHVPHSGADRFLEEARRLARLSHTGIVTVHDVGLHEGQVYIVSEYLEGPDLAEWLKHNSPSWPEAARIAAAVADALAHAHARLTVHRDVKPSNIILTPDRGPVLVDFGLALDDASSGGRELGAVSGTPALRGALEQVALRCIASTAEPTSIAWAWFFTR